MMDQRKRKENEGGRLEKISMAFLLFIVLYRIPQNIFNIKSIYSIRYITRPVGDMFVDYQLSYFDVLLLVIGVIIVCRDIRKHLLVSCFYAYVISYNLLRYIFNRSNPIMYESYEVFLSVSLAIFAIIIVCEYYNKEEIFKIICFVIFVGFITQITYILINKSEGGSYGSLALSAGGIASVYSSFIVLQLTKNKWTLCEIFLLLCASIGIFLSGSRTNILIFVLLLFLFFLFKTNLLAKLLLSCLLILFYILFSLGILEDAFSLDRIANIDNKRIDLILDALNSRSISYVKNDDSFNERTKTWKYAIEIISDNPLGISCSVIDLQNRMFDKGATTFPHSTILASYLVWGIPALIVYLFFWKMNILCIKNNNKTAFLWSFFIITTSLYGGIGTSSLSYFWTFLLIRYAIINQSPILLLEKETRNNFENHCCVIS